MELEKELRVGTSNCTDDQVKWILMQKLIATADSYYKLVEHPYNGFRNLVFKLVNSLYFELIILLTIVVNIIVLGMDYEGMSEKYEKTLDQISDVLTWIFVGEFVLKFISYGWGYFRDKWNWLDFAIVITSITEYITGELGFNNSTAVQAGPQVARGLRVIRVIRLVKLFKSKQMSPFTKLLNTLVFSLPTIMNILGLLLMVYFIFAVIGCFIFKDVTVAKDYDTPVLNFKTFHIGLLTLFVCSTGENWPLVMYNYGESAGNYVISRVYFLSYILITTFIMLNLFELVIVQMFESFYIDPDNVLARFEQISLEFNKTWNAFTMSSRGKKIHYMRLPRFFAHLE